MISVLIFSNPHTLKRKSFEMRLTSTVTILETYGYGKFSLRLFGYAMFSATFNLVDYLHFGTMKDDCLSINTLASTNRYVTETCSKMASTLSQNG